MHADRLGKYQLVQHLASGGMANVYLARLSGPGGFERHVVLKTLRTAGLVDATLIPMFLDEARLVGSLHHRHIAQVYEVGSDDGTYFLAMEYVHGETTRDVIEKALERGRMLPLEFGVTVVCAAAAGLHHAHERCGSGGEPLGIVHRDVTPSNVLVSYDGSIKLIDFGIAKADGRATHTRTGFIKGKVGYMAPEQVRGYAVDRRSDVFALGVLAYELTTQQRAFAAGSQFEALERTVHRDLVPPSMIVAGYPAALEEVILTALELDPDDRYPDADAMRRALVAAAGTLHLPLGEAAVVSVLDGLYGSRPEPWLVARVPTDDDGVTPVRELRPRRTLPSTAGAHAFARGSGALEAVDDSAVTEPESLDTDEVVTDRILLVDPRPPVVSVTTVVPPLAAPREPVVLPSRVNHPVRPALRRRAPRWPWVALVLLAGLVVGLAIALAIGSFPIPTATEDGTPGTPSVEMPPVVAPRAPAPVVPRAPAPSTVPPAVLAPPAPPAAEVPRPSDRITLHVISDPPGATVVLDGVRLGTAPYTAEVPSRAGRAWLKVRKSDRRAVKIQVSLDRDVTWNVRLPARR